MSRFFRCLCSRCCCLKWRLEPTRKVTILMVGLDKAGKTATVKGIQGENPQEVLPTVGFSSLDFRRGYFQVTILDVGGGQKIRRIWPHYYAETHGIIFVLDSSDRVRLTEVRNTVTDVLSHPRISGKPILVLANKQDKEGALGEGEIIESLYLEKLVSEKKCPCQIQACSAVFGTGKNLDKSILKGLDWILWRIGNDFDVINKRIEKDTLLQRALEEMARQERIERVKQLRREREEKEGDNTKDKIMDYGTDVDPFIACPFRPINEIIMENERKSQGMEMKLGNLLLKTGTEQEELLETQSQVGSSSQIREDSPFSDPSPGTALPEPLEKEKVTEPQKCEKAHLNASIKESKKRKFKRHHCVTTMNVSQSDPQTVKSPPHPLPDLAGKKNKKLWFRRSNWIAPINIEDTDTQSVTIPPPSLPDLAEKKTKKSWFKRSNWIAPMNVEDTDTQSSPLSPLPEQEETETDSQVATCSGLSGPTPVTPLPQHLGKEMEESSTMMEKNNLLPWTPPEGTRLPKLEPLGETHRNEFPIKKSKKYWLKRKLKMKVRDSDPQTVTSSLTLQPEFHGSGSVVDHPEAIPQNSLSIEPEQQDVKEMENSIQRREGWIEGPVPREHREGGGDRASAM